MLLLALVLHRPDQLSTPELQTLAPALPLFETGHCYVARLALNLLSDLVCSNYFILLITTFWVFQLHFLDDLLYICSYIHWLCVYLFLRKVYYYPFPFKNQFIYSGYFLTNEPCVVLISF